MHYKIPHIFRRRSQKFRVHQIFYDRKSKSDCDQGFVPLDNTANPRPDWYECWVILNFFRTNGMDEDVWYGFFSSRFQHKVRMNSTDVFKILAAIDGTHDVALFSHAVDQIIYFKNVFYQGEFWHPGVIQLAKLFIDKAAIKLDLGEMLSHSHNSCFSNYLIAKPVYWRRWIELAELFFALAEDQSCGIGKTLRGATKYGEGLAPMKVFIQERISSLVLAERSLRVYGTPLDILLQHYPEGTRDILIAIDVLKRRRSSDSEEEYQRALDGLLASVQFDRSSSLVRPVAS